MAGLGILDFITGPAFPVLFGGTKPADKTKPADNMIQWLLADNAASTTKELSQAEVDNLYDKGAIA